MRYEKVISGVFLSRPNRFIAHVRIDGREEICHVKNTGRCRELLTPGATVYLEDRDAPARKTRYDLIAAEKGELLINMDSQAPNAAARQWLEGGGLGEITELRQETVYGDSRFDFSFRKDGKLCYLEVKGVTLEKARVCAFPDAPTARGEKHLRELIKAKQAGFGAYILFVIQMRPVKYLRPNDATDPAFGKALRAAYDAGVEVLAMDCTVKADAMTICSPVTVDLSGE